MKITENELTMMRKIDRVGILPYPTGKGHHVIENLQEKGMVDRKKIGAMLTKEGEQELDRISKKGAKKS